MLNKIRNNKASDFLKVFFGIGIEYPTYLRDKENMEYVSGFRKVGSLFGKTDATLQTTPDLKYACDFQSLNWFQKRQLLKDVNKFFNGERTFDWYHVLSF